MARKSTKKSPKFAKKSAKPRRAAEARQDGVVLLSAAPADRQGYSGAPCRYIAAMPGWKRELGGLDAHRRALPS